VDIHYLNPGYPLPLTATLQAWHIVCRFLTLGDVIGILRFIGIMNAAVWFGGAVFFTFGAAPKFFSLEMLDIFGGRENPLARFWAGRAAQLVLQSYFHVSLVCALVAIAHIFGVWLYSGRRCGRVMGALLGCLLVATLAGGYWLQPKLSRLHLERYSTSSTPEQKEAATMTFKRWHGVSQGLNFLVLIGLGVHVWKVVNPPDTVRFVGATSPFRSG